MKKRHGARTRFAVHGPRRGLLKRVGLDAGALAGSLLTGLEERALWARFGL
jgi:serine protease SohB